MQGAVSQPTAYLINKVCRPSNDMCCGRPIRAAEL